MSLHRVREPQKKRSSSSKDGDSGIMDNIKRWGIWNNPIIKHLLAWMLLMAIGMTAWKMAAPVRLSMQEMGKAATSSTIIRNENVQPLRNEEQTTTTSIQNTDQQQKTDKVEVIIEVLNVRANPSPKSLKVGKLKKGTVVQVLEYDGSWLKIKTGDNKVGYISSDKKLVKTVP